jgi:hypothetical protein
VIEQKNLELEEKKKVIEQKNLELEEKKKVNNKQALELQAIYTSKKYRLANTLAYPYILVRNLFKGK